MKKIVIKTISIKRELDERGRVRTGQGLALDANRIREIHYLDYCFYITYETEHADFYKKFCVDEVPPLATKLSFSIKEEAIYTCPRCGREVEWDADEPYCPKCGIEGWVRSRKVKVLELYVPSLRRELEEFASKLFNVNAKYFDEFHVDLHGGFKPRFKVSEVKKVRLYNATVVGATIVENPSFVESYYDETEQSVHQLQGKFVVVKTDDAEGYDYHLLAFEGEPQLQALEKIAQAPRR